MASWGPPVLNIHTVLHLKGGRALGSMDSIDGCGGGEKFDCRLHRSEADCRGCKSIDLYFWIRADHFRHDRGALQVKAMI